MDTQHQYTIDQIRKAFENANYTKVPLDKVLDRILEEFYWKAIREQKRDEIKN